MRILEDNAIGRGLQKLFPDKYERAKNGQCVDCGETINTLNFTNTVSLKEYHISGMCQKCQDEFFN